MTGTRAGSGRRQGGAGGKRVADWPTYLLKQVPDSERRLLSASAAAQNISISDIIRGLLCERYRMVCPAASSRYDADRDAGATTILLRLQPKLDKALQREAARKSYSKRRIILETIASHYQKEEPS